MTMHQNGKFILLFYQSAKMASGQDFIGIDKEWEQGFTGGRFCLWI
jgi:hypothetical protein